MTIRTTYLVKEADIKDVLNFLAVAVTETEGDPDASVCKVYCHGSRLVVLDGTGVPCWVYWFHTASGALSGYEILSDLLALLKEYEGERHVHSVIACPLVQKGDHEYLAGYGVIVATLMPGQSEEEQEEEDTGTTLPPKDSLHTAAKDWADKFRRGLAIAKCEERRAKDFDTLMACPYCHVVASKSGKVFTARSLAQHLQMMHRI